MAVDVTLDNITSGYNITKINTNFQRIDAALQDAVSLSGTTPNSMTSDLDMNGNTILNLPAPVNPTDPVRFQDIGDAATDAQRAEDAADAAEISETNAAADAASAAASATTAAASEKSIGWTYDSDTSMVDPGAGMLRLNNATLSAVTSIAVDATDIDSNDVSDYVATWGSSTATNKGTITLRKVGSTTFFALYTVTAAVVDSVGWLQITVSYVTGSGTISDAETAFLHFTKTGDDGATGGGTGDLLSTNNLSDVASAPTSRTNLGLGTLATQNSVSTGQINNDAVTTTTILDDNVTYAKMQDDTPGGFIVYDATGEPVDIGAGTSGQFPQSNGSGVITWEDLPVAGSDVSHDLTSSSDVTLSVPSADTPPAHQTAGKVIATKASVALKTTDKLTVHIQDLVLDGTSISINTVVYIWVRINSVNSNEGRLDNGTAALAAVGEGRINLDNLQSGTTDTYNDGFDSENLSLLASDFISTDGNYTVDILACTQAADDTPVVKGTTTTTKFNLRVEA